MQDHGNDHSNKSPLGTVIFTVPVSSFEHPTSNTKQKSSDRDIDRSFIIFQKNCDIVNITAHTDPPVTAHTDPLITAQSDPPVTVDTDPPF